MEMEGIYMSFKCELAASCLPDSQVVETGSNASRGWTFQRPFPPRAHVPRSLLLLPEYDVSHLAVVTLPARFDASSDRQNSSWCRWTSFLDMLPVYECKLAKTWPGDVTVIGSKVFTTWFRFTPPSWNQIYEIINQKMDWIMSFWKKKEKCTEHWNTYSRSEGPTPKRSINRSMGRPLAVHCTLLEFLLLYKLDGVYAFSRMLFWLSISLVYRSTAICCYWG